MYIRSRLLQGEHQVEDNTSAAAAPAVGVGIQDEEAVKSWEEQEKALSDHQQERSRSMASNNNTNELLHPKRKCLHRIFVLIKLITLLAALAMAIGQLVGIILKQVGPIQYVLRIYIIVFCFVIFINEMEWTAMIRESQVLSNWVTRGAIYSFVGVIGLEENDVDTNNSRSSNQKVAQTALIYIKVVAWGMVGTCHPSLLHFLLLLLAPYCLQIIHFLAHFSSTHSHYYCCCCVFSMHAATGLLYFMLGVVCCQIVSKKMRTDYDRRLERAKERRQDAAATATTTQHQQQSTLGGLL